jgi:hypothetical protein
MSIPINLKIVGYHFTFFTNCLLLLFSNKNIITKITKKIIVFLFPWTSFHLIQVRIDDHVFSQGIIQKDTLMSLDKNTWVIPKLYPKIFLIPTQHWLQLDYIYVMYLYFWFTLWWFEIYLGIFIVYVVFTTCPIYILCKLWVG